MEFHTVYDIHFIRIKTSSNPIFYSNEDMKRCVSEDELQKELKALTDDDKRNWHIWVEKKEILWP